MKRNKLSNKEKVAILFLIVVFLIILLNYSETNKKLSGFTVLIMLVLVIVGSVYRAVGHKTWK